jgi:hypothetical protein
MRHVVAPGDFPGWLAGVPALQGLALLVVGEFRLAPHLHTAGLCELPVNRRRNLTPDRRPKLTP